MTQNKRWGKRFIDNRNHKEYQNELLKRYEIYLDLEWVDSWSSELKQMNRRKEAVLLCTLIL